MITNNTGISYDSLYPHNDKTVIRDPDWFLLHTFFDYEEDILFTIYKNYKTEETILKQVPSPMIPVFLSKQPQKFPLEYIDAGLTNRVLVNYKNKSTELKNLLFEPKWQRYTDKYGYKVERPIFPDIPNYGEYLHPDLYMADITIEEAVYMDYTIPRYKSFDGGVSFERVSIPDLHYASFDIETIKEPDGTWKIHTNTFVDEKDHIAYLDHWIRPDFNRQNEIVENKEKFIQCVRDTLNKAIDECSIKNEKKKQEVQRICREIADKMQYKIREYNTESELIKSSVFTMLNVHSPDILMAFNTPYDLGNFYKRGKELNLNIGLLNRQGIGFDHTPPTFTKKRIVNGYGRVTFNLTDEYAFHGDQLNPKKRRTYLNVIAPTMISDFQTTYFSARQGSIYASYNLDSTATEILGFGKFDYSHITNHITKLAKKDYWWHSVYALIDSILLIMMNRVTQEYKGKLSYTMRTKVNIEETASSNSAITRCIQTDAFINGWVPGNNLNKLLRGMKKDDVDRISKATGIDYSKQARAVRYKHDYGGGWIIINISTGILGLLLTGNGYQNKPIELTGTTHVRKIRS